MSFTGQRSGHFAHQSFRRLVCVLILLFKEERNVLAWHAVPQGNGNLVLSRKLGEEILVGDLIIVRVEEIRDLSVRLSVSAPKDMVILRRELKEESKSDT